jgi:hypothetical protein
VNGERDILGLWVGDDSEGAKFWLQILTELKNRGMADVCNAVCDGLRGLPDAINTVWELTTVQACIIHLIRNTFRYASRKCWDQIARDLRPVIPPPLRPRPGIGSSSSPRSGAGCIRASSNCGRTPGRSLCRSSTTEAVADCLRRGASVGSVAGCGGGLAESAGAGGALRVSLWRLIGESS